LFVSEAVESSLWVLSWAIALLIPPEKELGDAIAKYLSNLKNLSKEN
jgi:hypothetical protein